MVSARNHGEVQSDELYTFRRNVSITLRQPDVTSFIETDKAFYKPSDTGISQKH
jgi:hypothetical protein